MTEKRPPTLIISGWDVFFFTTSPQKMFFLVLAQIFVSAMALPATLEPPGAPRILPLDHFPMTNLFQPLRQDSTEIPIISDWVIFPHWESNNTLQEGFAVDQAPLTPPPSPRDNVFDFRF